MPRRSRTAGFQILKRRARDDEVARFLSVNAQPDPQAGIRSGCLEAISCRKCNKTLPFPAAIQEQPSSAVGGPSPFDDRGQRQSVRGETTTAILLLLPPLPGANTDGKSTCLVLPISKMPVFSHFAYSPQCGASLADKIDFIIKLDFINGCFY